MMLQIISIYLVVDLFLILKVSTHLHNVDTFLLLYHHMIGYIKLQEHWLNDEAASEACREFIISYEILQEAMEQGLRVNG